MRAARYALNRLRDDQEDDRLRFRTVWKHRAGRRGHWQVIVSSTEQLLFDAEPLFRSDKGRKRHVRPHLRQKPIEQGKRSSDANQGEQSHGGECDDSGEGKTRSESFSGRSECKWSNRRNFQFQQTAPNTPPGGGFNRHWRPGQRITPEGRRRLQRKAGAITRRLSGLWWDNAKISDPGQSREARAGIFGYVWRALREGHEEKRIAGALDVALHHLHGTATDRGEVFTVASTITRARDILSRDTRSESERATTFYSIRRRQRAEVWAAIMADGTL